MLVPLPTMFSRTFVLVPQIVETLTEPTQFEDSKPSGLTNFGNFKTATDNIADLGGSHMEPMIL